MNNYNFINQYFNIMITLFLGLFAGLIIVNLIRFNKAWKKHKGKFDFKKFAIDNLVSTAIVLIAGLVIMSDPEGVKIIEKLFPPALGFQMTAVYMMFFGIGGDVILKGIWEMFNPKKQTAVGVNKKI